MHQKFLRYFTIFSIFIATTTMRAIAQPCADTQPSIAGAQVVTNNQDSVIYSTPFIPGHIYAWTVTGGVVISGAGTNQIKVTWGPVGVGSVKVVETNPAANCSTSLTRVVAVRPLLISYLYYTNTSCYGDVVSFHDASVADVAFPITNYLWTFGDGASSTLQNPQHMYLPPYDSTYDVRLVITNSIGYTDTIFDAVYVNPNQYIPTANFLPNVPACMYDAVSFNSSTSTTPPATVPIELYAWNFNDPSSGPSNTSTLANPSHFFTRPGTYNVSLMITNHMSCTNTVIKQVVIDSTVPTSKFVYSSPTCLGNRVNFTNQSTSPTGKNLTTWIWNFGDGSGPVTISAPNSPNTSHVFPGLGPYGVRLTVINSLGCRDSITKNVSLDPSPASAFTQDSQCFGDTVHFTDHSIRNGGPPIVSYSWNFDDPGSAGFNTSTLQNPTHKFTAPATYNIMLVTTNSSGCPDTLYKAVEIHDSPSCDYTWNFGGLNNEVHFHIDSTVTNLSIIGNMVIWNFGDGTYGYGHNPVHIYPTAGIYDVVLTVTDTLGCQGHILHSLLIPSIPTSFFSSNSPQCFGQPICFHDLSFVQSPPFGFIKTWIWNYGDATPNDTIHFPNPPDICHTYASIDTFLVTLTVIDNSGFTDDFQANVWVLPDPVANFQQSTACQGMLVNFTNTSTANGGGNIISNEWNFADPGSGVSNTSGLTDPSHIFSYGDSVYMVQLIIENFNGCRDTIVKPVHVFPAPPINFTFDTACLNQLVHFNTDTMFTHKDSIVSWQWNFGDGSPLQTDPLSTAHLYNSVGTFLVTLTVTDHHGCVNDTSHTVRVNPLPVPSFTWTANTCQGTAVQFTDNSFIPAQFTGYVAKWQWDFHDGSPIQTITIPNSPSIQHTFPLPATSFLVTLTVWSGDSCTDFVEHTIDLLPAPVANFQYDPVNCKNQPVQFHDISQTNGGGSITQWLWNFDDPASGGGNLSPLKDPVHTFTTPNTTYHVCLIVISGTACRDTICKDIYIRDVPPVDFSYDTACLNSLVHYNAQTGVTQVDSIVSWQWSFGDGSPSMPDPITTSHMFSVVGTYTTTLTVTDNHGCINSVQHQVRVNPLPVVNFTWNAPLCQGSVVLFTDQSTVPTGYLARWQWDFGDGSPLVNRVIPAPANVTHTFTGPGPSYPVTLTVWTNDSCTQVMTKTVTMIPAPIAGFEYSSTSCANQAVQFHDLSQPNGGGNILQWHWDFGDIGSGSSNQSDLQDPMHTFTNPGTYTVTLVVTNASNCRDTVINTNVTVNLLPVADFSADTACLNSVTTFTDLSVANANNIVSYSWNFGDGQPFATVPNPTHLYGSPGVYQVTLTIVNSNGCVRDTTIGVLVNPLPIPEFTFTSPNCVGAPVSFTDQSSTPSGYLGYIVKWVWDFQDGTPLVTINFPNPPDIIHVFGGAAQQHTVTLTVKTSDSCSKFISHLVNSIPSPVANFSFLPTNCTMQPVQFNDDSQPNGGGNIITWDWDFDDTGSGTSNSSTAQNPVHDFTTPGLHNVTLIIKNASNCSDTIVKPITINDLPVADFSADTACLGTVTTFTDASTAVSGTITNYHWDFGDGGISTQASPTYLYATPGIKTVTLTVTTSNGCIRDTTKQVLVIDKPTAGFSWVAPACAKDSVQFHDLSLTPQGSIVKWDWNFGDGATKTVTWPTSPDVKHAYSGGGSYVVTLVVSTSDSCHDTKTNTIIIQAAPLSNFDFDPVRCEHTAVQFHDLTQPNGGSAVTQWDWDFGDPGSGAANSSNIEDPQHAFSTSGTFQVHLQVTNASGCHDSITKAVSVDMAPTAQFTADTACTNSPTQFTDQSVANVGTIVSWLWNFGDVGSGTNNTSTLPNPTHNYASPGTYTVVLSVTNSNSCVDDTTLQIIVNPKPQAMFQYTASCVMGPTQFTDWSVALGSQVISWFWDFGDGIGTDTVQNPTYTYATAGTYNVKLRITNLSFCQDSIIIPVTSRPVPVASFIYTNFFCPAGQVNFQDQSHAVGAAVTQHLWIFEPGYTSTLVNPVHTFAVKDTTYLVSLIVTDNYGCQDTITDSVYVKPGFSFTFTSQDTVCFKNPSHFYAVDQAQGDSLYSVVWDFGEPASGPNNISYLYNPTHTYLAPGQYTVKLKAWDSDNCVDSVYKVVTVHALPQPEFTSSAVPCDSVIHFTDLSLAGNGNIISWDWDFGDGTFPPLVIAAPGPGDTSHLYVNQGFYNVILKVTNSFGCIDTVSRTVQRLPCIKAAFVHADTLLCARYPIAFSDSSLPVSRINTWTWSWGDGTDTTYNTHAPVVTHTFTSAGTYHVRLTIDATVSTTPITDSTYQSVVIHATPLTYFSNTAVCLHALTLFRDTSNTFGVQTTKWNWNFGEPYSAPFDTSTTKNPTHRYDSAGYFDVKLMVMNIYGCKDSLTKPTRVYQVPTALFRNDPACSGNPTYFYDSTAVGDTLIGFWRWRFGDVASKKDTSLLADPIHVYKTDGDYNVRLIVQDKNGCRDTVDSTITVHVTPLAEFSYTDNVNGMTGKVQLNNSSVGATLYSWDFGNGQTSNDENPIVTYASDGTYIIKLISSNEFQCSDTTYYKYEVLFKGLYVPNAFSPSNTNIAVRLFKPAGINLKQYLVQVFDSWGHLMWESTKLDLQGRPEEGWDGTFNGELMPQGTYMWRINAVFIDDTIWQGSDIGKGAASTMGTVSLIR
jgi:PKD repeat protein